MSIAAQDGFDLEFASEELRADRQVVLAAVKQFGNALEYASKELRADREIVLAAVKRNGWALRFASKELRADRQFVLAAVKAGGDALQFASVELRADREVVLAAVAQRGDALRFASEELRTDGEITIAAVGKLLDDSNIPRPSPQYSPRSPQYSPRSPQYSPHPPQCGSVGVDLDTSFEQEPSKEESVGNLQAQMQSALNDARKQILDLQGEEHTAFESKTASDRSWLSARDAVEQYSAALQVLPNLDFMQGAMHIYKENCRFPYVDLETALCHEIKRKRADARDCMEREDKKGRIADVKLRKLDVQLAIADAHAAVLERML